MNKVSTKEPRILDSRFVPESAVSWKRWTALTGLMVAVCSFFVVEWDELGINGGRVRYRLPSAATGVVLPDSYAIISLDRVGIYRISSGEEMALPVSNLDDLRPAIHEIVRSKPDRPFVLKAPDTTDPEIIQEVLTLLQEAGVEQVYFQTILP